MDYKAIGFKSGLEIHQQIDGRKLFCSCPCLIKDDKPDFKIKRFLRTSASELGAVDKAAQYEKNKNKYFIYQGYKDVNCLIELDEEPIHEVNKDALNIALQVSLLLNCKINHGVQFMRKIVIDGSNVSGFQRTALVAEQGFIETSKGKVRIQSVCLEEEAAKKVEDNERFRVYNISRLGIPLVEIATEPDIKDPEHAKECAEKIGMILRSIKGIKRGLGTIRQDVNISIKGGARTEIKGFQDYKNIPKVLDIEIQRQLDVIKEKGFIEEEVRTANLDFTTRYERPMPGADRMYPETDCPIIKIDKQTLKEIELPELLDKKIEILEEKYSLQPHIARELIKEDIDIESYIKEFKNLEPKLIASVILESPKEVKARFNLDAEKLTQENFKDVLRLLNEDKVNKSAVLDMIVDLINLGKIDLAKYQSVDDSELENEIKNIVLENKGAPFNALMGEVMKKFKGKCDGKKASELIRKFI